MVTSGATEALAGALLGLIEEGDEVVVFQPFYDAYVPLIRRAGGIPRFVRLEPPHWRLTDEALRRVFTPKTKFVIFTIRSTRRRWSIRARTSNCWHVTVRSSTW